MGWVEQRAHVPCHARPISSLTRRACIQIRACRAPTRQGQAPCGRRGVPQLKLTRALQAHAGCGGKGQGKRRPSATKCATRSADVNNSNCRTEPTSQVGSLTVKKAEAGGRAGHAAAHWRRHRRRSRGVRGSLGRLNFHPTPPQILNQRHGPRTQARRGMMARAPAGLGAKHQASDNPLHVRYLWLRHHCVPCPPRGLWGVVMAGRFGWSSRGTQQPARQALSRHDTFSSVRPQVCADKTTAQPRARLFAGGSQRPLRHKTWRRSAARPGLHANKLNIQNTSYPALPGKPDGAPAGLPHPQLPLLNALPETAPSRRSLADDETSPIMDGLAQCAVHGRQMETQEGM
jgi:hypothetical protein